MWNEKKYQKFKEWMAKNQPGVETSSGMLVFLKEWIFVKHQMEEKEEFENLMKHNFKGD